jgi:hypothetical protein
MTKSLEQIRLFLDEDPQGARVAAMAHYVIAEGMALRENTLRVEHPALRPRMEPSAFPRDLWMTVLEAIRTREGLAE